MADMMQFDLVSPERRVVSVEARAVQIPGADGDLTAMPDHAPLITTLRPGVLTVETGGGETTEYMVTGGFAEVSGPATIVLAERAAKLSEVSTEEMDEMIEEAREAERKAREGDGPDGAVDAAAKLLNDMVAIRSRIASGGAAP